MIGLSESPTARDAKRDLECFAHRDYAGTRARRLYSPVSDDEEEPGGGYTQEPVPQIVPPRPRPESTRSDVQ